MMNKKVKIYQYIKRVFDLVFSALILVALSPLLLLAAFLILVFEGRPVTYLSYRNIKPNKQVLILKFRSMVKDAISPKYRLNERFMRDGYLDIPISCEVYTRIGKILEMTQLVEVPQLLNVLFHGMSLVGNRPLPQKNLDLLSQYDGWEERFKSPCGLTGISQIIGKGALTPKHRLELEKCYTEVYHQGNILKCDLLIVVYTIRMLVLGKAVSLEKAYELLKSCLKSEKNVDK